MAGKGMKGLAILMKPGGDEEDGPASGAGDSSSEENDFLGQAFDALKDDDASAFTKAMKGAMRACYDNESKGEEGE